MIPRRDFLANGLAAVSAQFLTQASAFAQSKYPERAIRLVVPFPPGGGYDAVARPWAERIKPLLGTVVIENMGGGGSSLGAAAAARARPDGYTLLLGGSSTHITEALLKNRPLYDPIKDLEPISNIALAAFAFAIHPSVPARSLSEFIARAKANPGKLSYGHAGVGSLAQSSYRRAFQVAGGNSGFPASPLSRFWTGNHRCAQRTDRHGHTRSDRRLARISSHRQAADSFRHRLRASYRSAGHSNGGRSGAARHDFTAVHWTVRAGQDTTRNYRADIAGVANGPD